MDNDEIRAELLFSLYRNRKWGESHTAYENLLKYFRSKAVGKHAMKNIKKLAEELVREGFILAKPTNYGLQISLNPRKADEIKKLIKEKLGFDL